MQSLPNPANLPPPVRASPMVAHESILQRFRSPKSITFRVQVTGMMPQEWQGCPKDDSFVHPFVAQPSGQLFVARQKRGFIRIMLAAAGRKGLIALNYIAGSRHKIEWQSHTVNLK